MKIDTAELQQVVETTTQGRPQLYTTIHKALRVRMTTVLTAVGQMDAYDDQDCREVMNGVEQLLDALHHHVETENTMVHPAIEARKPGALGEIIADHNGHEVAIEQLRHHVQTLLSLSGKERAAFSLFLYRDLSRFVAENLEHMLVEETHNQQLLWSAYSDKELMDIHGAILASLPPETMAAVMPWLISAVSVEERLEMFEGMRATAPASVFEGALTLARSRLPNRAWGKLSSALGVAAISGQTAFAAS